jgi:HD-GYP domain-containing protein (c-di-GMP phosphodiesterase class II)
MKKVLAKRSKKKTDKEILREILKISEDILNISDIDILLDKILYEVRRFTSAEGGTIFMVEDNKLRMSYTQNDILFEENPANRYKYLNKEIPLDPKSIAGATAINGDVLEFKDVYKLGSSCACGFNKQFDIDSGYRTKSMISIPLKSARNRVIGVMQIINAKDENGKVGHFTDQDKLFISYFANDATIAIEKAKSTRAMVLRMLRMVEYRDPKETGGHVNRIGTYAVEIYQRWAEKRGFPAELIRRFKDKLKIAAMLHDAGKIAISDQILKKPGKLDEDEFNIMKMHAVFGYRLFSGKESELDAMCAEIALSHHEKWDGSGYPGKMEGMMTSSCIVPAAGKKDMEIPITGRIVAVADVYDALISKRVYKDAWDEDHVLEYMKASAGTHFDPEVVEAFFEIYDIIKAIREQFKENPEKHG